MANLIQSMQDILSRTDRNMMKETRRIVLKKYLQALTLDYLYNHPLYRRLNFYGGTCLHMIYGLNRLSEDIDLDNTNGVDIVRLEEDLLSYFRSNVGYADLSAKTQSGEWGIRRTTLKFPVLFALGLTSHGNASLHLKVEVSQHKQVSIIQKTPILVSGRSFVAAHFSIETLMAGKMLACLERSFQKGKSNIAVKGRDYYDLLWFMQKKVHPLEAKLAEDGSTPYTVSSAFHALAEKVNAIKTTDLAVDLMPLFEQRAFIEAWLEGFKDNFSRYLAEYLTE